MRTSEKDSALKEETIGKRLRGGDTGVLVCSVGSGEAEPCNILPSLPFLKSLLCHDSLQKLFNILGGGLKIFFLESQVIPSLKSYCCVFLHLLWILLEMMTILWEGGWEKKQFLSYRKEMHFPLELLCSADPREYVNDPEKWICF